MEENKFKIYSKDNSLYIISNTKIYSLNIGAKSLTELDEFISFQYLFNFMIYKSIK